MPNEYYQQLDRWGESFVKVIGGLTQIAQMHMDNNILLIEAAEKFTRLIETSHADGDDVSIMCLDGRLYFQKKKLTIRQANKRMYSRMLKYMENRSVRSLSFQCDLSSVEKEKIIAWLWM